MISGIVISVYSAVAIADRVGHESIDITYKYAHLFPSKQTEMAEQLEMKRMERMIEDGKGIGSTGKMEK